MADLCLGFTCWRSSAPSRQPLGATSAQQPGQSTNLSRSHLNLCQITTQQPYVYRYNGCTSLWIALIYFGPHFCCVRITPQTCTKGNCAHHPTSNGLWSLFSERSRTKCCELCTLGALMQNIAAVAEETNCRMLYHDATTAASFPVARCWRKQVGQRIRCAY